ncbi:MAG TPA: HAMP domain-containing protein, partial [Pyrinomonadaceae bacterium]|nr:HAMP domain-containing protein [Pyrinomonadaceae bacterium]
MSSATTQTTAYKAKTNGRAKTNGQAKADGRAKTNGHAKSDYLDPKQLLSVLTAVKKGDFSSRMSTDQVGVTGKIYDALNEIIERNETLTSELGRISEVVGKEGKITQRAKMDGATGAWGACVNSVNTLITDLTQPTTEVARVIGAVAEGDLSQNFNLEIDGRNLKGEFLRTGKTVNTMVAQLGAFASEVTRV